MKKLFAIALSVFMVASLAACGGSGSSAAQEDEVAAQGTAAITEEADAPDEAEDVGEGEEAAEEAGTPETVTITSLNAEKEAVEIEVPYNPQRIAVLDLAMLDIIDNLGFGDRVVGVAKSSSIDYLQDYINNDAILNLGTIKEASMEAVMECEPDVIFIGGRLSASYEAFEEIAPVVFLSTDVEIGLVNSVEKNAMTVASMFGAEEQVTMLMADFDERIETLQQVAEDKTAFVGMLNSGGFNALGNDGRCSLIGVEVGFENIGIAIVSERGEGGAGQGGSSESGGEAAATSAHGNESSFEYIVQLDPDYIFVMNRDDAIGTEGAETAQEVIENELVMKTAAYANGNIVYLQYSNVWYTAEGGITALDYMLRDLESALL